MELTFLEPTALARALALELGMPFKYRGPTTRFKVIVDSAKSTTKTWRQHLLDGPSCSMPRSAGAGAEPPPPPWAVLRRPRALEGLAIRYAGPRVPTLEEYMTCKSSCTKLWRGRAAGKEQLSC